MIDKELLEKGRFAKKLNVQKLVATEDEELTKEASALTEARKELSMINLDSPLREARDSLKEFTSATN